MENLELTHHGIKGMKWGIRRTREQLGRVGGYAKKKTSTDRTDQADDHEDARKVRDGRSARSLSDAELRARLNRIQMEKQYAQLTAKEKSAGAKFVQDVLLNAAKETAKNYASQYMKKGVDALIKKMATKSGSP